MFPERQGGLVEGVFISEPEQALIDREGIERFFEVLETVDFFKIDRPSSV